MKSGDRIIYRGKRLGVFHRLVKHTRRWDGNQMALVSFDDACRCSRVEARLLTPIAGDGAVSACKNCSSAGTGCYRSGMCPLATPRA
jgi:hypothetical protein